ncbi:MAG: protein phosphatase 2C domain-containing protein, partial [Acidobacteriota bacterium]|nr:protein phosphatase 2C domain-containing protein [Acidobacteriota bacterium]
MTTDRTGSVTGHGLRAAARTDRGRVRDANEDRFLLDLEAGVFLVIDGVGGHAAGEVAARIAHDTIQKRLERQDANADVRIREAITLANQQILLQAADAIEKKGMACVLTLAVLEGRRLTVGHVGDTRLYRLSPDGIAKMTHDHSPIGEREDAREISETEAMQHARRNEVYRDVGSEPREPDATDFIETIVTTVDDDTALLLCSDGLSDMLPSLEINRIVRAHAGDPARVADALIDAANDAGGRDNVTVMYVEAPRFARAGG